MAEPVSNEVLDAKLNALEKHVTSEFEHVTREFNALRELLKSQRTDDQLAIKTALDTSKELAAKHNDLIRLGERKDATYATKDDLTHLREDISANSTQIARLWVGGVLIAIGIVTNFVKLWF